MKRILIAATALALLASPFGAAFAQGDHHDDHHNNTMMMDRHDDHHGNTMMMDNHNDHHGNSMMMNMHHDWHKGGRIERGDWDRGARINDWHRYHLSRPPRGYEWRRVDNNYVLAAVAGGLIASVIAASSH